MKKAALTFALISTVLVATSFETPEKNSSDNNQKFAMHLDTDTGGGNQQGIGGRKKLDVYNTSNQLNSVENQLTSLASNSQLSKSGIKLD
ncbi:MAG: hypothetical protein WAM46_03715 [Flavobacterium sp.]